MKNQDHNADQQGFLSFYLLSLSCIVEIFGKKPILLSSGILRMQASRRESISQRHGLPENDQNNSDPLKIVPKPSCFFKEERQEPEGEKRNLVSDSPPRMSTTRGSLVLGLV